MMTLTEFAEVWLRRERNRLRVRSVESYDHVLRKHLLPTLGALDLAAVTRDAVRSLLLSKLDAGYAPRTVSLWLNILSALFNAAVDDALVSTNVCGRIGRLLPRRKGPAAQRALNVDEFGKFLEQLGSHPLRPLFVLAVRTGMRLGELLALRWDDVQLAERRVIVRHSLDDRGRLGPPKGGRAVTLPLSREAQEALDGLPGPREADDWVFRGPHGVHPSRSFVKDVMRKACQRAGIPHASPHALRHAFCSNLVEQGATAWEVQQLARHASVTTSQLYIHTTVGERHLALVNALDRR